MAKLRAVYKDFTTKDYTIVEGEQYKKAKKLLFTDFNVMYCFYWSDADDDVHNFYTYPIERADFGTDVEKYLKERNLL